MPASTRTRFILVAVSSYLLLALCWILLSDQLLAMLTSKQQLLELSTAKGIFFVLATAALFFFCLRAVPTQATPQSAALQSILCAPASFGQSV